MKLTNHDRLLRLVGEAGFVVTPDPAKPATEAKQQVPGWFRLPPEVKKRILSLALNPVIIDMGAREGSCTFGGLQTYLPLGFSKLRKTVDESATSPAVRKLIDHMDFRGPFRELVLGFDKQNLFNVEKVLDNDSALSGFLQVFSSKTNRELLRPLIEESTISYCRNPSLLVHRLDGAHKSASSLIKELYLRVRYSELASLSAGDIAAIAALQLKTCIVEVVYRRSCTIKLNGKTPTQMCCRECVKNAGIYALAACLKNCQTIHLVGDTAPGEEEALRKAIGRMQRGPSLLSEAYVGVESFRAAHQEKSQCRTANGLTRQRPQRLLYRAKLKEQRWKADSDDDEEDAWWW